MVTGQYKLAFIKKYVQDHVIFKIQNQPYIHIDDETYPMESDKVQYHLCGEYQEAFSEMASKKTLSENLLSHVHHKEDIRSFDRAYKRCMRLEDKLIYDLCDGNVIEITEAGYQKTSKKDQGYLNLFKKDTMVKQTHPETTDESLIEMIQELTQIKSEDKLKVYVLWLVSSFFPDLKTPILMLLGEQGSGKSVLSELTKRIVDPSTNDKQHSIKKEHDFAIVMRDNYMTLFDNLSNLKSEISDAMCQSVSGGQFSTRKLYTTDTTLSIDMQAKMILNGITISNTKPDLLERSILLRLEKLTQDTLKNEETIESKFKEKLPKILHRIFTVISGVFKTLPEHEVSTSLRMNDFARYAVAIGEQLEISKEEVIRLLEENQKEVNEDVYDDPLFEGLIKVLDERNNKFHGTASDLLKDLKPLHLQGLPGAPNSLSAKLTRNKHNLKQIGITFEKRKESSGKRIIHMEKQE